MVIYPFRDLSLLEFKSKITEGSIFINCGTRFKIFSKESWEWC